MSDYYITNKENGDLIDIKDYPSIELISSLHDIFLLDGINEYRKNLDTYDFLGTPVPRVSNILRECIAKEYLMNWAARLGVKGYIAERNKATTIGSRVHEMIEHFLLYKEDKELPFSSSTNISKSIDNAYENFKLWYSNMMKLGYTIEIIAIEKRVSCPYYGGTIDCIARINGKVYIIDFKTSKSISYEYIIQTCAYMWNVNNGYAPDLPHIDGIGIIRVDKEKKGIFEDYFLNEHIPYQREIINQFFMGFGALLASYYHNINMRFIFSKYKSVYNIEESVTK